MKALLVEILETGAWSWEPVARLMDASNPPRYEDALFDAACLGPDDLNDIAADAGVSRDAVRMRPVDAPEGWQP